MESDHKDSMEKVMERNTKEKLDLGKHDILTESLTVDESE